jgi:hypothetical protein
MRDLPQSIMNIATRSALDITSWDVRSRGAVCLSLSSAADAHSLGIQSNGFIHYFLHYSSYYWMSEQLQFILSIGGYLVSIWMESWSGSRRGSCIIVTGLVMI